MKKKAISLVLALALVMGLAVPVFAAEGTFSDVPPDNWAYPYVAKAAEKGWVSGYADGRYGPNDQVSYAQLAVMVTQAFFRDKTDSYQGTSGEAWFLKYTVVANDLGLFKGTNLEGHHTDGTMVGMQLSRYEMGQFLYNTMIAVGMDTNADQTAIASNTGDWNSIPAKYWDAVAAVKDAGIISGTNSAGNFGGAGMMNRAQAAVVLCKFDELFQDSLLSVRKQATVTRIVDGDTIVVNLDGKEETVRLIGVDTPESVHPDSGRNTDAGDAASLFTKYYLNNQKVELEFDVQERDQYNRLLAYVYIDDEMFNEKLLQTGHASIATYPPNIKYVEKFTEIVKHRDPSIPTGKYLDGYMEAPSVIYKSSADTNKMDLTLLCITGVIIKFDTVDDGTKYCLIETNDGYAVVLNYYNEGDFNSLKIGDTVSLGVIYWDTDVGSNMISTVYSKTINVSNNNASNNNVPNNNTSTSSTQSERHTVYVTKTGKKYHYSSTCNGGTYYASTLSEARSRGLTPCSKCVP